ncbi:hypothetical protein DTD17_00135 [Salmonella enterica]|nr:hypothetical protein [Salmonella enterica]ECB5660888.1 hypothetical protein [Salmonella enterica subsp. enterica serovar Dublin]
MPPFKNYGEMTMKTRYSLIILLNAAGLALFLSWYLPVNHGYFDWPPLVADDPAQRPGDNAF